MKRSNRDFPACVSLGSQRIKGLPCLEFKQRCSVVSADLTGCLSMCVRESAALLEKASTGSSAHPLCAIHHDGQLRYTRRCMAQVLLVQPAANSQDKAV
jgi:hypothetical protein